MTATPTPTPTPIPKPRPALVLQKQRITLQIDANGLLNNVGSAINNVKQQIRGQTILRGRAVGLAIAYGGAPTSGDIPTTQAIAAKTYDMSRSLGQEKFAFENASYYASLYRLGDDVNTITIGI